MEPRVTIEGESPQTKGLTHQQLKEIIGIPERERPWPPYGVAIEIKRGRGWAGLPWKAGNMIGEARVLYVEWKPGESSQSVKEEYYGI